MIFPSHAVLASEQRSESRSGIRVITASSSCSGPPGRPGHSGDSDPVPCCPAVPSAVSPCHCRAESKLAAACHGPAHASHGYAAGSQRLLSGPGSWARMILLLRNSFCDRDRQVSGPWPYGSQAWGTVPARVLEPSPGRAKWPPLAGPA
jgi:hypothetical protein